VDGDSALEVALATGIACLQSLDFTLTRPPADGWIETVGDSNMVLRFCAWVDQNETSFVKARSEAVRVTKNALEGAGFSLPEPIYRLNISSMPAGFPQFAPEEQFRASPGSARK
jgi:small conductance mechanosensitive channel